MRKQLKTVLMILFLMLGVNVTAQQKIQLNSTRNNAKCEKSDMTSLRATFSFSELEAQDYKSTAGEFSLLSMPNTVIGGNEGDPEIPVVNELIAVPVGATPHIKVKSYRMDDYKLDDYGMKTVAPRQPSLRKDKNPSNVPFVYNQAAYEKEGLNAAPNAMVEVVGTMRGVRIAKMTIEPVSYDPVKNTVRVFNDIEVEVEFEGGMKKATDDLYTETYSPYFDIVYKQLFNGRAVKSAYDDHPDLYTTPVKMLVVTTSTYANCDAFQEWLTWKKQKGIDVDVQVVANGASASTIKNTIYSRYNANHPTFLVLVGDETVVTYYQLWDYESTYGDAATDLEYASVDGDVYHDMFLSRMPVSSTTELANLVHKILTYEKYTMSDPSYLNNVLLIAGADDTWAPKVGRPTINYAADNYFNTEHGFSNIYKYVSSSYTGCYNYLSSGVGFANYTAHGDIQKWHSPEFTNSNVNALTNNDKYFWAMGNCCLTANFKNAQNNQTCFGEAMVRAANKGAFGYIGSVPESYWYEDYYFGVGATSIFNQTPMQAQTKTGVYDAMFDDTGFNTLNAVPFIGNVAVTYAHANSYTSSVTDEYYWRAYQCFGDGSVMPYLKQPAANNVNHDNVIFIGTTTFQVSADAGSYVSITKDNEILGVAVVPSDGTIGVPVNGLETPGEVMVVVTRQQRQPYIATINAIVPDGPYISLDSYTPQKAIVGEETSLSLSFKNIGADSTEGTTNVTLSSEDTNITISGEGSFEALAKDETATLSGFSITFNEGATLGSPVSLHYTAVNGDNTWEGNFSIIPNQIFTVTVDVNNAEYGTVSGGDQFEYDASCTVSATPADGYMFVNWTQNGNVVSTDAEYTFNVTGNVNLVANFTEGVMIGSGSSTNENLPSYTYYNYSLSEQIYTPAELGNAGIITSIAFYNDGAEKTRNMDFYMKTTTKSSFSSNTDWIAVSAGDKVFSGSVTLVSGEWTTITFSAPFVYDGTSNVVLVVDDNSGTYTSSPNMACRVFDTTGNQAIYYYDDSQNFNPLSPPTTAGTHNSVLSQKNQLIVSKAAIPEGSVNIAASINPAQAGTVSGSGEYQFGQACTVTVTPAADYTFIGWTENGVVVSTDLSYSFTAVTDRNLVADFIQATEIGQGTTNNNYLPTYNYYKYSMTEQIYTADEMGEAGNITSIAFYNEGAEKTRTLDLYLKATSKSSFSSKTDWVAVAASDKVFSGDVTLVANDWTFITFTTPFEYDGSSNVVLVVDDNSNAYSSSPYMACSAYSTGNAKQAIYIYSDDTDYNPSSPTTSQNSGYDVLQVKNHILISKEGMSDCVKPRNLTATEIGPDFVKLSWTERGTSEEWVVACGDRSVTADTNTDFVLDGLDPSTSYTIKVRPVCDETLWSDDISVTTLSACPVPTELSVSDITHNSAVVSWTGYTDSYELQYAAKKSISYDFEDGWQGWTALKGNEGTSPNNWMHNTEYTAYDSNGSQIVPECHNASSGMMLSESYISAITSGGSGQAVTPDNYLISPQIPLGGSITFYAAARMSNYPKEKFSVLVSTTGNSISDFTNDPELTVTLTNNSWKEYTVDLSAYSGMGYVAIRHYDCRDQHLLYIDDVTIAEGTTWITVNPAANPCTLSDLEPATEYEVKVKALKDNDESDWSEVESFTTFSGLVLADNATDNSALINALIDNNDVNKDVMLVGRTLYKDGEWNTLCLPFNVTLADSPLSGATAKTLADATMNNTHVSLTFGEAVTELEAGVPYIIKWEGGDNIVNPEFKNVTISEPVGQTLSFVNGNVKFIGYYNAFDITPDDTDIYYMTAGSTLKHTGKPRTLKACRAYFQFSAEAMKRIQQFVLDFGGDVTTGIISIDNEKLNESGWYTVDGKKLEQQPTRKGLYIHNGVKVVIK